MRKAFEKGNIIYQKKQFRRDMIFFKEVVLTVRRGLPKNFHETLFCGIEKILLSIFG